MSGWLITRMENWQAQLIMGWCAGVWITAALWLVTRHPWCSVFACAAAVGWLQFDNWATMSECRAKQEEIAELEKQVIVLRSAMHEMATVNSELEAVNRRARRRSRPQRDLSTCSL